jgi:hypothetical protein
MFTPIVKPWLAMLIAVWDHNSSLPLQGAESLVETKAILLIGRELSST